MTEEDKTYKVKKKIRVEVATTVELEEEGKQNEKANGEDVDE